MIDKLIIDGKMELGSVNTASSIIYKDINGNNLTLQNELDRINRLIDNIHPIGSIYITTNEITPSELFGGVWEKIEDKFLLASSDNYTTGSTGGEKAHKITIDELPNHNHTHRQYIFSGNASNGTKYGFSYSSSKGSYYDRDSYSDSGQYMFGNFPTGGDKEHNNMPPYLVVNIWKRVE